MSDWMGCETRGTLIMNSLKNQISALRKASSRSRKAYTKDYMLKPCVYYADACDDAADVLQSHLDTIKHARDATNQATTTNHNEVMG